MAADMLCAYSDRTADSRLLFETTKLAKRSMEPEEAPPGAAFSWDEYMGRFDVIQLVMTDFLDESADIEEMLSCLMSGCT